MAEYGELLNTFNPHREEFYSYINNYFNNPILVKTKNVSGHSIYMIKTICLLSRVCRYIIAVVPQDNNKIGQSEKLSNLNWVSFQTRTLDDMHNIGSHNYQPRMEGKLVAKINRIKVNSENSLYNCKEFPIEITLLHKTPNGSEYQPQGNIISALETFQTILTFID